jgi:glycosyltransferase involved in cell wall biosynthesis
MNISIVTVVFNSEKTIANTIESILNQSIPVFEYLIIDGCSTDDTLSIINSYIPFFKDKGIAFHVFSERDSGIYDAMNKGINHAKGDWIGILNSDDFYENDTIESLVNFININNDCELIFGDMNLYDNSNYVHVKPNLNLRILYNSMSIFHPSIFIKKRIYDSFGCYSLDFKLSSDWDFVLKLYHNNVRFFYLNKILSNFTIGGAGSGFKWIHFKERFIIRHKYFRVSTFYYDLKDFIILLFFKLK